MNVSAYLADRLGTPFTLQDNMFFDSKEMINNAQKAPPNSVFQYDEAREGLATAKRFTKIQQDLIDFFNECGQLNHVFVLVLPDFFSLNWELATNRSEILLNVYRQENETERRLKGDTNKSQITVFERGHFEFYNRKRKQMLYWQGKRSGMRIYGQTKPNFRGRFTNNYPLDENEYRQLKREALSRFIERHTETPKQRVLSVERVAYKLLTIHKGELSELARRDGFASNYYSNLLSDLRLKIEKTLPVEEIRPI